MKKIHLLFNMLLFVVLAFGNTNILAQGVTTASVNGFVSDSDGSPLPGANYCYFFHDSSNFVNRSSTSDILSLSTQRENLIYPSPWSPKTVPGVINTS